MSDVVEIVSDVEAASAGTAGAIVAESPSAALVEIAGDPGKACSTA